MNRVNCRVWIGVECPSAPPPSSSTRPHSNWTWTWGESHRIESNCSYFYNVPNAVFKHKPTHTHTRTHSLHTHTREHTRTHMLACIVSPSHSHTQRHEKENTLWFGFIAHFMQLQPAILVAKFCFWIRFKAQLGFTFSTSLRVRR